MSPRPQKVSDEQLFQAAYAVMHRVSPQELTLAAIAEEAGVTAAVIVQRFGSKRDLMLALTRKFAESSGSMVEQFAKRHSSPLAALRAYAECVAGMAASPAAYVRSLAYLQADLTDAEFRRLLATHSRTTRRELQELITSAVAAGELRSDVSPAKLARLLEALLNGSMLTWVLYQEGTATKWVRADFDALLQPYLASA